MNFWSKDWADCNPFVEQDSLEFVDFQRDKLVTNFVMSYFGKKIQKNIDDLEWQLDYVKLHHELLPMYVLKLNGYSEADWNQNTGCFEKFESQWVELQDTEWTHRMCGYDYESHLEQVQLLELKIGNLMEMKNE
jgi:hypothetical protein